MSHHHALLVQVALDRLETARRRVQVGKADLCEAEITNRCPRCRGPLQ